MNYINDLRYSRNITRVKLVEGIVSITTYNRYLNGDAEVSFDKIALFANRLGFEPMILIEEYLQHLKKSERNKDVLFTLEFNKNFNDSILSDLKRASDFGYNVISQDINQVLIKHFSENNSSENLVETLKQTINFKNLKLNKLLNDNELYCILLIAILSEKDCTNIIRLGKLEKYKEILKMIHFHNYLPLV